MRLVILPLLLGTACTVLDDIDNPPEGPLSPCDPIDPSICALPFPSAHFLTEDETTATGLRVDFKPTSMPLNRDGIQGNPKYWNEKDGFSINSPMIVFLPYVDLEGTVPVDDIGAYEAADAKTVIVNVETGERVPHWVESDATAPADEVRVTLLRPAKPLEFDTHYVVGFRNLNDVDGEPIAPSPAFKALRDLEESPNDDVKKRRQAYEEVVFPTLSSAGFPREELQIAWDFHTVSRDATLGKMEAVVDDALAWVDEQDGFDITFTKIEEKDCDAEGAYMAREMEGTFTVPLYTVTDESWDPDATENNAVLTRGDDGMPFRNGTTTAEFLLRVPCSVVNGADGNGPVEASAPIVQYGHGLLGDKREIYYGGDYLGKVADRYGFLLFSMDWVGFADSDYGSVAIMVAQDPSEFAIIPERSTQGMMQQVLGTRMMITDMVEKAELTFEGKKVIDPARPYYYGISQGGIMGAALLGVSPDIQRGVLGVGGSPYSLLLPRSKDFDPFFVIFRNKYDDHREIMMLVAGFIQTLWDPVEPGGWMWDLVRDRETPKDVLMQVAIYDHQVTTLGAHIQARAYGAYTPKPAVRPIWGVPEKDVGDDGMDGPAIVEWKYSFLPDEPTETVPPGSEEALEGTSFEGEDVPDPHDWVRQEFDAQEQLWHFLETGKVIQTCSKTAGCVVDER